MVGLPFLPRHNGAIALPTLVQRIPHPKGRKFRLGSFLFQCGRERQSRSGLCTALLSNGEGSTGVLKRWRYRLVTPIPGEPGQPLWDNVFWDNIPCNTVFIELLGLDI